MTNMKQSGIEWVGEIPAHWNIHPVYFYFGERKRKNRFGREENLLSLSYGKIIRKDINTSEGLLPESFNTYNIVEDGDIIIRPTDLQNDKRSLRTGLVKERGIITSAYIGLMPIKKLDSRFFNYQLHAYDVIKVFYNMGNGVRQGLNYSEFSKLLVFEPPLAEQKRIADFLDSKCAEIDGLVADIQSQIDTLEQYKRSVITETVTKGLNPDVEMKDSGIEWVGMIPNNWNTSKIKYIAEFAPHCDVVQLKPNFVVGYAPMECIKRGYFIERTAVYNSIPNSLTPFENGDIVMAKVTPCFENGNIAIMENLQSGIGFGSSELFVLRPKMINTKYLFYWLQNDGFIKKAASTMTGMGGLKRVSPQFVQDSFICIPTIAEQKRITEFLDTKCTEIDTIIDQKKE